VDEERANAAEMTGTRSRPRKAGIRSPADDVGDFLDQHTTAKIVVIVDTHCLEETGSFIYKGSTPETYEACRMKEVCGAPSWTHGTFHLTCSKIIQGCIPERVRKYLSDAKGTVTHSHRSIILNLACGASIENAQSRHSLFDGYAHCMAPHI
jgi:hypothetical protein